MDKKTKKIWEEIVRITSENNAGRVDGEYTVKEFIREVERISGKRIGRDTARRILEEQVSGGTLKKRKAYLPEYETVCALYSPV